MQDILSYMKPIMAAVNTTTSLQLIASRVETTTRCLSSDHSAIIAEYAIANILLTAFQGTNSEKRKALIEKIKKHWPMIVTPPNRITAAYNSLRQTALKDLSDESLLLQNHTIVEATTLEATTNQRQLQSILIYGPHNETTLKVYVLLSAPWNVKRAKDRCHGAGLTLIHYIVNQAQNNPAIHTIILEPFDSASWPFQNKMGFKRVNDTHLGLKIKA